MDLLFKVMLFLHLGGLAVGTTATVAMPLLGRQLATAAPAAKPALGAVAGQVLLYSRLAFGVLIVTGVAMVFLRFNGDFAALGSWFHLKMALVLVVLAAIIVSIMAPARVNPRTVGIIIKIAILGIVASAVMAFS